MPIDIQKMFSDFIPDTAKQDFEQGQVFANNVGQLGSAAALLGPTRARQLRRGAGGLFGVDLRSPREKLAEQLQGIDISTQAGQDEAFELISAVDGNMGIQFRAAMAENAQNQLAAQADAMRAEAAKLNAETNQAGLTIDQQRANTADFLADLQERELSLGEQTQEDLQAWRAEQLQIMRREAAIKEEANRIDEMIAQINQDDLGSRDRAAIREATEEGRAFRDKTNEATRIANEFKSLQPMAGAASLVVEKWRDIAGNQDEVSLLRRNFNAIKNEMVMDNLPPGVASDKDIEIAMSGFPTSDWNAEQIYSFMQGMAKISAITAEESMRRARHLAENRGTDENFEEEWNAFKDSPEFEQFMADKYGIDFVPADSPRAQESQLSSGPTAQQRAQQLLDERRRNNQNRIAPRGATL